jgi:hypothetical protein
MSLCDKLKLVVISGFMFQRNICRVEWLNELYLRSVGTLGKINRITER